jgi:hypothetical protein
MFFVLIITKEANDEFTQVVFRYDTWKQARAKFYYELFYDAAGRKACSCTILNQGGAIVKQDCWDDSAPM